MNDPFRRYVARCGAAAACLLLPFAASAANAKEQVVAAADSVSVDVVLTGQNAARGGEIRLQTDMAQGRDLLAGKYVDSIMIAIDPRVREC